MRKILVALILLIILGAGVFLASPVNRVYLPTATGISAKQVCSLHFVSGLSLARSRAHYIDPLLEPALPDSDSFQPLIENAAHRRAHFDEAALSSALDTAFAEPSGGGRNTLAVVVLHEGRLVAERYAEGIDAATPLHGWSMTKSVVAALARAMVHRRQVRLDHPGFVEVEGREDITLEHLLRMTSGLAMEERSDGFDPNSDMLFTKGDMAGWASRRERLHPPGEHWQYMSGNTVLAARTLQNELGDTLPAQITGLRDILFDPLDVRSAVMEVDQHGTFQGSSYLYASAHDWARLAQLFLQDGVWNGERILAEGWVDAVTRSNTGARENAYGMGFWLGHPADEAPSGIYYMSGFQGQYAIIVPSHELVVVRLGASHGRGTGSFKLVLDLIAAMDADPSDELT